MPRLRMRLLAAPVTAVAAVLLLASPASAATRTQWHMNEAPGTGVMYDETGTINGTWEDIVADGSSYFFNGSSSRVIVPDHPSLDPGTADFSVSVRFKTDRVPSDAVGDFDLIRKGLSTTRGGYYKVEVYPNKANTKGRALCQVKGTTGRAKLLSGASLPNLSDNQWHTITCDRTGGVFSMHVDGSLVASKTVAIGKVANGQPLTVGAKNIGGDWHYGYIDDAAVEIR
jgi:concanavalin A-like lectin/glucanase superfamily protein